MHFALESVDRMLDYTGNVEEQLMDLSDLTDDNNSRYTLIRMDGTVVADTEVAQVNQMENHLERKEVKDALATGYGYSVRRSGTLGMQMAYAAIRSSDGKYILRLSACSTGLGEYILMLIPAAFLSFGIAFFASAMEAERFSQSITRPLQEISSEMVRMDDDYTRFQFEKCPYEEINVIADTTTRMSRNMKKYLERIEKEKQIRQEFFSNASHELKTPLTSIRVLADSLMGMENAPAELYQEFMQDISAEIDREGKIIDDLLTLVKMDKSSPDLNIAQTSINGLLEQILKRLTPIAKRRNIEITYESKREVSADVDEVKLSLALSNLVENAIKYNREEGKVWVTLDADHKFFYVKVEDNGVGIPKEFQERVFERFYRVDKARSRETGGTGLGLAITKNIILLHQGAIRLKSEEGKGATFTVRIPLNYIP